MNVGYSDFVKLCRVDDPETWASWLSVRADGVYVQVPPNDIPILREDRAALTEHPTKNLAEPALRFPCSLDELQTFLEDHGVYGCIDAFDMAEWVLASASKKPLVTIEAQGVTVCIPHMTKTLDAVFKVMRENWTDPNTRRMPKPRETADEIDRELGWKTQKDGTPSRDAAALARAILPSFPGGDD